MHPIKDATVVPPLKNKPDYIFQSMHPIKDATQSNWLTVLDV